MASNKLLGTVCTSIYSHSPRDGRGNIKNYSKVYQIKAVGTGSLDTGESCSAIYTWKDGHLEGRWDFWAHFQPPKLWTKTSGLYGFCIHNCGPQICCLPDHINGGITRKVLWVRSLLTKIFEILYFQIIALYCISLVHNFMQNTTNQTVFKYFNFIKSYSPK